MATHSIDVTKDHCPMTFVKAKIALSKLQTGEQLEVLLLEGEALNNVPKAAVEQGYKLIGLNHHKENIHRVVFEK
jgi:TusA-related sulfurtransferase